MFVGLTDAVHQGLEQLAGTRCGSSGEIAAMMMEKMVQ